ncbi:unnamed protein product [Phytomonas sp. EM1]|nr:unnamed protein product [Phytomonas sp. EM1]|eukprot:CCW61330.1 unnamed protein product [Phytomonas sp. isolate EM1]
MSTTREGSSIRFSIQSTGGSREHSLSSSERGSSSNLTNGELGTNSLNMPMWAALKPSRDAAEGGHEALLSHPHPPLTPDTPHAAPGSSPPPLMRDGEAEAPSRVAPSPTPAPETASTPRGDAPATAKVLPRKTPPPEVGSRPPPHATTTSASHGGTLRLGREANAAERARDAVDPPSAPSSGPSPLVPRVSGVVYESDAGGGAEGGRSVNSRELLPESVKSEVGGVANTENRRAADSPVPALPFRRSEGGSAASSRPRSGSCSVIHGNHPGRSSSLVCARSSGDLGPRENAFGNQTSVSRYPPQTVTLDRATKDGMQMVSMHFNTRRGDSGQIDAVRSTRGAGEGLGMDESRRMQPKSPPLRNPAEDMLLSQMKMDRGKTKQGVAPLGADVCSSTTEGTPGAMTDSVDVAERGHPARSTRTSKGLGGLLSRWFCCRSEGVVAFNRLRQPHSTESMKDSITNISETRVANSACDKKEKDRGSSRAKKQLEELRPIEAPAKPSEEKGHGVAETCEKTIPRDIVESHGVEVVAKETLSTSCSLSLKLDSGSGDADKRNELEDALDMGTPQEHREEHQDQLSHLTSAKTSLMALLVGGKGTTSFPNRVSKNAEYEENGSKNENALPLEPELKMLPLFPRLQSTSQTTLLEDVDKGDEIAILADGIENSLMLQSKLTNNSSCHQESLHEDGRNSLPQSNSKEHIGRAVKLHSTGSLSFSEKRKSSIPGKGVQIDDLSNDKMHVDKSVSSHIDCSPPDAMAITIKGEQSNGGEKSSLRLNHSTRPASVRFPSRHPLHRPRTQISKTREELKGGEGKCGSLKKGGEKKGASPHPTPTRPLTVRQRATNAMRPSLQDQDDKAKYAKLRKQIIQNSRIHSNRMNFHPRRNTHRAVGTKAKTYNSSIHNKNTRSMLKGGENVFNNQRRDNSTKYRDQPDVTADGKSRSNSQYACQKENKLLEEVYELHQKLHKLHTVTANAISKNNTTATTLLADSFPIFSVNSLQERANAISKANLNEGKLGTIFTEPRPISSGDGRNVKGQEGHRDNGPAQHAHWTSTDSSIFIQRSGVEDTHGSSYAERYASSLRSGQSILRKHFPRKQIVGDFPKFYHQRDHSIEIQETQRSSRNGTKRNESPDNKKDKDGIQGRSEKYSSPPAHRGLNSISHMPTARQKKIDETVMLYESLVQLSMLDDSGVAAQAYSAALNGSPLEDPTRTNSQRNSAFASSKSPQSSDEQQDTSRGDLFERLFYKDKMKIRAHVTNGLTDESYINCLREALRHEYYGGQSATFSVVDVARAYGKLQCEDKSSSNGHSSGVGESGEAFITHNFSSASIGRRGLSSSFSLAPPSNLPHTTDPQPPRSSCAACSPQTAEPYAYWGLLSLFEHLQRPCQGGARGLGRPVPTDLYAPSPRPRRDAGSIKGGEKGRRNRVEKKTDWADVGSPPIRMPRRPFTPFLSAVRLYLYSHQRGRRAWRLRRWNGGGGGETIEVTGGGMDLGIEEEKQHISCSPPGWMANSDATSVSVVAESEKYFTPHSKQSSLIDGGGGGRRVDHETPVRKTGKELGPHQDETDHEMQGYSPVYVPQFYQTLPENGTENVSEPTSSRK